MKAWLRNTYTVVGIVLLILSNLGDRGEIFVMEARTYGGHMLTLLGFFGIPAILMVIGWRKSRGKA